MAPLGARDQAAADLAPRTPTMGMAKTVVAALSVVTGSDTPALGSEA